MEQSQKSITEGALQNAQKFWGKKPKNAQKLNNIILINELTKKEIMREIRRYLEVDENGNTTYKNLWDEAKVVLRGKFIVINAYNYQEERS